MKAYIAGTGRVVPPYHLDTAQMAQFVQPPDPWTAPRIERKLGIHERRFMHELNSNTGKPILGEDPSLTDEVAMAARAARQALEAAEREAKDVDLLILVSCTAQRGRRRHFSRSAFDLHLALGLPAHARIHEMDAGCGGAVHALELGWESILSGRRKTVLIVASSEPSLYMDRDFYLKTGSWLSSLIFGDGAAAAVLCKGSNGRGIIDAVTSVDPGTPLMDLHGDPDSDPELAYWIDGRRVREAFAVYAASALETLKAKLNGRASLMSGADAFIFHQVNANVLRSFVDSIGLPQERVPINVDRRGNIAAAATLDILDEEVRAGRLGKGAKVVICAVGAGAQIGAVTAIL